jgi:hypothetical protein
MRKVRRVMGAVLLFACGVALAQDAAPGTTGSASISGDTTVLGRDDSVIPVPPPEQPPAAALPAMDTGPLPSLSIRPEIPAAGIPVTVPDPKDVLSDALSQ